MLLLLLIGSHFCVAQNTIGIHLEISAAEGIESQANSLMRQKLRQLGDIDIYGNNPNFSVSIILLGDSYGFSGCMSVIQPLNGLEVFSGLNPYVLDDNKHVEYVGGDGNSLNYVMGFIDAFVESHKPGQEPGYSRFLKMYSDSELEDILTRMVSDLDFELFEPIREVNAKYQDPEYLKELGFKVEEEKNTEPQSTDWFEIATTNESVGNSQFPLSREELEHELIENFALRISMGSFDDFYSCLSGRYQEGMTDMEISNITKSCLGSGMANIEFLDDGQKLLRATKPAWMKYCKSTLGDQIENIIQYCDCSYNKLLSNDLGYKSILYEGDNVEKVNRIFDDCYGATN